MTDVRFTKNGSYDASNSYYGLDQDPNESGALSGGIIIVPGNSYFSYSFYREDFDQTDGFVKRIESYGDSSSDIRFDYAAPNTDGLYVNAVTATFAHLTGGAVGDYFIGSNNDDILNGAGGDDTLFGGAGNDVLIGGAGADALNGGDGLDVASYATATGGVEVRFTGGSYGADDAGGDTYINIENITGSAYGDFLEGDSGDNVIDGGAGGGDYLIGGAGNDTLAFASVPDELQTGYGSTIDQAIGGDGFDVAQFSFTGDARLLQNDGTTSLLTVGYRSVAYITSVERVEIALGSQTLYLGAVTPEVAITGDAGDTIVRDQGMANVTSVSFDGGAGDDSYQAGAGYDRILFTGTSGVVANFGTDTVTVGGTGYDSGTALDGYGGHDSYLNPENIDAVESGTGDDTIILGANRMNVSTGDGDDLIVASPRGHYIDGGAGIDTVSYADASEGVTASLGDSRRLYGNASFAAAPTDTLIGVENLGGSQFDDKLTGDFGDNVLTGNGGADTFYFSGGNDTFVGDGEGDIVSLAGISGTGGFGGFGQNVGATVSLAVTAAQGLGGRNGSVTLSGITGLVGSYLNDTLTGDAAANTLSGAGGDDVLTGGAGGDVLDGGSGIDTASYAGAAAGVTINLSNVATNSADAAGDSYISIERIVGTGFNDTIRGDRGVSRIDGGAGDDTITIAAAPYDIDGGSGTDRLIIGPRLSVSIDEDSVSGIEQFVVRHGATVDFSDYPEDGANVRSSSSATNQVTIIGSSGRDRIIQGAGADHLSGGDGNDFITITNDRGVYDGGEGNADQATITGGPGAPLAFTDANFTGFERIVIAGGAVDFTSITGPLVITVNGSAGIRGGAGDDTITGSSGGNDVLAGGLGADQLSGKGGADIFAFLSLDEIATGPVRDGILDFSSAEGDRIALFNFDVDPTVGGMQSLTFIGSDRFTGENGSNYELRVLAPTGGSGDYRIQIDLDHDRIADRTFTVHSDALLTANDFILSMDQLFPPKHIEDAKFAAAPAAAFMDTDTGPTESVVDHAIGAFTPLHDLMVI